MTKKRFIETLSTGIVTDNVTGKEYKCEMRIDDELLGVMNALHEENQSLKQSDTVADLETQIMHLKEELDYYKSKCASLETGLINEQRRSFEVKQVLKERFGDNND